MVSACVLAIGLETSSEKAKLYTSTAVRVDREITEALIERHRP